MTEECVGRDVIAGATYGVVRWEATRQYGQRNPAVWNVNDRLPWL